MILSWQVPTNCLEYRLKFSDKPIVDWLGYDQKLQEYAFNPEKYTPFFAAFNFVRLPEIKRNKSRQFIEINMQQQIHDYNASRGYVPGHPLYLRYDGNSDYHFKLKFK